MQTKPNQEKNTMLLKPAEQIVAAITKLGGSVMSVDVHPIAVSGSREIDLNLNSIPDGEYLLVATRAFIPVAKQDQL